MAMIQGMPVRLYDRIETGVDDFNSPIYRDEPIRVENVLICPASAEAVTEGIQMYGKRAVYELCIPKGNTNVWEDRTVEFFGRKWQTFGPALEWIGANVPLGWNKRIKVERYG